MGDSVTWTNPDGDSITNDRIAFRCKGCGLGIRSTVFPWTPTVAKFICRRCEYEQEVQTRELVMDRLEGHVEEGAYEESLKKRSTNSNGAGQKKPGRTAQVIRGRLVYVPTQKKIVTPDD